MSVHGERVNLLMMEVEESKEESMEIIVYANFKMEKYTTVIYLPVII